MTVVDSSLDAIRHAVPSDLEREAHDYAIDGVQPQLAFRPDDADEMAVLLAACNRAGLAVVPQGARTALNVGRPLERYDVALDLRSMHRVVEYVPDDLTITVEAGMTLRELQDTLEEHGQYLPVDPPPGGQVTIGGLLATARSGPWRGHLPAARDLILGATLATAEGKLIRSGGRVVKNVTGYDLHRLNTGALGAFGVIVEASFKLAPVPAAQRGVVVGCNSIAEAAALATTLWNASLAARAISVLGARAAVDAGHAAPAAVLIDLAGSDAAVERSGETIATHGDVVEANPDAWRHLADLAGASSATVLRAGVPATALGAMIEDATTAGLTSWGHIAAGAVWAHRSGPIDLAVIADLRRVAERHGGFLTIEAASPDIRQGIDPAGGGDLELVRALRDQFDPDRSINPGRWGDGL
jgi:glycolate oxidase FAD binding subunit